MPLVVRAFPAGRRARQDPNGMAAMSRALKDNTGRRGAAARTWAAALALLAWAHPAEASFLPPELEDSLANFLAPVLHGAHQRKALSPEEEAAGLILTCCATPTSDCVIEARSVPAEGVHPVLKMPVRVLSMCTMRWASRL